MSILIELVRDIQNDECTLGRLIINGKTFFTMERPWVASSHANGGKKGISCIPFGEYKIGNHNSEMHPNTFYVTNPMLDVYYMPWEVPKEKKYYARTAVLIHSANYAHELRGCIAPGKQRVKDNRGRWMVTHSRDAMNEVRNQLRDRLNVKMLIANNLGGA